MSEGARHSRASRVSVASMNTLYLEDRVSPSPSPVSAKVPRRTSRLRRVGRHLRTIECHGISSLASSSRTALQVLWALILVAALGVTVAFLVESTRHFLSRPIVTSYDLISDSARPLPDLHICPCNAINSSFMRLHNIDPNWASFFVSGDAGRDVAPVAPDRTTAPQFANLSLTEYFQTIGYRKDAFFRSCSFKGVGLNCSELVTEMFDEERGKCFLLKLPAEHVQTRAGEGLELLLDIHTSEYPPLDSAVPTPMADGATVSVSANFTPGSGESLLVAPGTMTAVTLEAKFVQRTEGVSLGLRQSCVPLGEAPLSVLRVPAYTQPVCQKDCRMRVLKERCGCIPATDPAWLLPNVSAEIRASAVFQARGSSEIFCLKGDLGGCVREEGAEAAVRECERGCEPPCAEWQFNPKASHLAFPDAQRRRLAWADSEYAVHNLIHLRLHFSKLEHVKITQSAQVTFPMFVSNVGGTMGVWLGASLLTVLQALIVFATALCSARQESYE